jgi:Splicing factor 3B subunit 10 (SF3b10)
MAADRFSINKSWDQVQNKFVGTGHSDMSKFEWASNQHRDTIASHIGRLTFQCLRCCGSHHRATRIQRYLSLHIGTHVCRK